MTAGIPVMRCPVCQLDVPTGAFCGTCGAHLSASRGAGRSVLRPEAYAAASGEHTLRLSVVSSLFPHLPQPSRAPFRIALAVLFLALVALGLLRWQAPLIAVSALGLPLLFLFYLHESDMDDDLPLSSLVLTALLGLALGVGWALLTGDIVAGSYDVALGDVTPTDRSILESLLIPAGGPVLMLLPAVVVRLLRPGTRESLDGFVIGALGAIAFHRRCDADTAGSATGHWSDRSGPAGQRTSRRGGNQWGGLAIDRRGRGRFGRRDTVVQPSRGPR